MAGKLIVSIGYTIADDGGHDHYETDLTSAPHILVGGTTGSGKSVFLHSILVQLLLIMNSKKLNVFICDPKLIEFEDYRNAPQVKVVANTPEECESMLSQLCRLMQRRYEFMKKDGLKNMLNYSLPNVVIIIDEMAELVAPQHGKISKSVMAHIHRLAFMGRAASITLIVAVPRCSVDVITGSIKNCFSFRVAFKVAAAVDSWVILDQRGAEKLDGGPGDMLIRDPRKCELIRLRGIRYPDPAIKAVVNNLMTGKVGL